MSTQYGSTDELQEARENIWKNEINEERNYQLFDRLYILVQALMVLALALIASWMGFYGEGIGFQAKQEFRWHPLLMSTALLFINGEAILMYRGFRFQRKVYTKTIHASIQACGVILMLLGLKAVYDTHSLKNFASVHSWVGLLAMGLYAFQWTMGFTFFVLPSVPVEWRKKALPPHRLTGMIIFLVAAFASLMGVTEFSAWSMTCWTEKNELCTEMLVANVFALVIVSYAATVLFLVSNPFWARQPLPSESEEAPVYSHDPLNKRLVKDK
uniref:Cytochrome b561 domain-containing protein n=1 Tax=Ditylenchus dipsaci TaxID=166011 RepID=A0A915DNE0_9BILA